MKKFLRFLFWIIYLLSLINLIIIFFCWMVSGFETFETWFYGLKEKGMLRIFLWTTFLFTNGFFLNKMTPVTLIISSTAFIVLWYFIYPVKIPYFLMTIYAGFSHITYI